MINNLLAVQKQDGKTPLADNQNSNDMEAIQKVEAEMENLVVNAREQSRQAVENARSQAQNIRNLSRLKGQEEGRAAAAATCQRAEEEARVLVEAAQKLAAERYEREIQQMNLLVQQALPFIFGSQSEDFLK